MNIGVYAIEQNQSRYTRYTNYDNTVLGIVGAASKGPIGEATLCTSYRDLINKFGPLNPAYYGLYAGQYFLTQASKLYFVRAASSSAAEATAAIAGKNASDTEVSSALTLKFKEKGSFYNDYKVTVSVTEGTGGAADKYTLTVKSAAGSKLVEIKDKTLAELTAKTGNEYDIKVDYVKITAHANTAAKLTAGDYTFASGNDGVPADNDYIYDDTHNGALKALRPDTVDISLLAVPGASDSVISSMLTIAGERKDCLCIVDPPKGKTISEIKTWQHTLPSTSYGALYYDWLSIYDATNQVNVEVPPSVVVPAVIARSTRMSDVWFAPAGLNRGTFTGAKLTHRLTKGELEDLNSIENNINPIYEDPTYGPVLWGQKTLQTSPSALDRINVRRLLNYLKKSVVQATNDLTFEPNDRITWNKFVMKVTPILESVKNGRGIYEYRIIAGESIVTTDDIDNYKMPGMILIRPTKTAEDIPIYFVLTDSGTSFDDVLADNGIISNN